MWICPNCSERVKEEQSVNTMGRTFLFTLDRVFFLPGRAGDGFRLVQASSGWLGIAAAARQQQCTQSEACRQAAPACPMQSSY